MKAHHKRGTSDRRQLSRLPASFACILTLIWACVLIQFATEAHAQCSTRDASQNSYFVPKAQPKTISSAASARVWKVVKLGIFLSKPELRRALDTADCSLSEGARRMIGAKEFRLSTERRNVELVAVSVAELGIRSETAPLKEIYSRALDIGFTLVDAEIGPLLRLEYTWQPFGEFDNIGMEPIMQKGTPQIFVVANGGAGLLLLSEEAGPNATFLSTSSFIFARGKKVASSSP